MLFSGTWQVGIGSVMVWAGISYDGRTDLHVFMNGTVTGLRYRDEILSPYVVPYAGAVGQDFILMDDNATAHRSRIVTAFLDQQGIERMDWPARSPDLNPLEHAWDMLQRRIQARDPQPSTRIELANALVQEWGLIPLVDIRALIRSFPNRLQEVITARGGHTHYWGNLWCSELTTVKVCYPTHHLFSVQFWDYAETHVKFGHNLNGILFFSLQF